MDPLFDFTGKVALVTGGSRGLGYQMVKAFAERGADVIIASRKLEACEAVAEECRALGRRALAVACHAGRWDEIDRLIEVAYAEFGRVDILVNNAGMGPRMPSHEVTEALFDSVLNLNFKGPFRLASQVAKRMYDGDGGCIINVSSTGALMPLPQVIPYGSSKAALNAMSVSMAAEYAPKVRVNTLSPGPFLTDIAKAWSEEGRVKTPNPRGRPADPQDIITAALFLASPASVNVTGTPDPVRRGAALMPRAIMADGFGPPESYAIRAHDPGPPKAGEVRIAIKAAGVSYVDVLTAMGDYQFKPPLPFIPGSEYAGVIAELGEDVAGFAVGDKVFGSALGGPFAEAINLPARSVSHMPGGLTFAEAAVFPVNYQTAYYALADRGRLQPGETLLVLGAAGGTGFAAVQVGKHLGARVIASASSPEKQAAALAGGADAVVTTGAANWRDQVKAANDGKAIDVVFDPVGGDATELAFRTLGYDGRHLVIGFPAGIAALKTNLPLLKSASLIGVQMRGLALECPEAAARNRDAVMALAATGALKPVIAHVHAFEDFAAAMNAAFAGKAAGRIVLSMSDENNK